MRRRVGSGEGADRAELVRGVVVPARKLRLHLFCLRPSRALDARKFSLHPESLRRAASFPPPLHNTQALRSNQSPPSLPSLARGRWFARSPTPPTRARLCPASPVPRPLPRRLAQPRTASQRRSARRRVGSNFRPNTSTTRAITTCKSVRKKTSTRLDASWQPPTPGTRAESAGGEAGRGKARRQKGEGEGREGEAVPALSPWRTRGGGRARARATEAPGREERGGRESRVRSGIAESFRIKYMALRRLF